MLHRGQDQHRLSGDSLRRYRINVKDGVRYDIRMLSFQPSMTMINALAGALITAQVIILGMTSLLLCLLWRQYCDTKRRPLHAEIIGSVPKSPVQTPDRDIMPAAWGHPDQWYPPVWSGTKLPLEVVDFYHSPPAVQAALDIFVTTYGGGMGRNAWPEDKQDLYRPGAGKLICEEFRRYMKCRYELYFECLSRPKNNELPKLPEDMRIRLLESYWKFFDDLRETIEVEITVYLRGVIYGLYQPDQPDDQEVFRRVARCLQPWKRYDHLVLHCLSNTFSDEDFDNLSSEHCIDVPIIIHARRAGPEKWPPKEAATRLLGSSL